MKKLPILFIIVGFALFITLPAKAFEEVGERPARHLEVEVWLNKHNGAVYEPGRNVRVYFRASEDCYLAVYNVDTEGFVHMLYPKYDDNAWVIGDQIYQIPDPYDDYDLVVDGPRGIEYVVAIASYFPMNLRALYDLEDGVDGDIYWPAGRITGDPHLAIKELNDQLAWGDDEYDPEGYANDVSWFYVRQWVPYPRYIVYQWYPEYIYDPWWDPYDRVHIFVDFYWDHYWCRPWWWCRSCQPIYVYWYIDRDTGRRYTWKGHYHDDRRKPDWYRDKPVRRGGGIRPSQPVESSEPVKWDERRGPAQSKPDTDVRELEDMAKNRSAVDVERRSRPQISDDDLNRAKGEQRTKRAENTIDRKQIEKSKMRSRQEIRPKSESNKSRSDAVKLSPKSAKSTTKKLRKSSDRSSGLGKFIGSVAKIFTGNSDSKKEKSDSKKTSKSTSSQKDQSSSSSKSRSSKESSDSQDRSRKSR